MPKKLKAVKRFNPFEGQITRKVFNWGDSSSEEPVEEKRPVVTKLSKADIVTSEVVEFPGKHKVVIDVDFPVVVTDSTTKGHHHLFIDKELTWDQYTLLLATLVDVGIIESGYYGASMERGFTGVRLPWVKKPQALPKDDDDDLFLEDL